MFGGKSLADAIGKLPRSTIDDNSNIDYDELDDTKSVPTLKGNIGDDMV